MRFVKCKDYDEMSRRAAELIASQVLLKPACVLGLATGSSPIGTYKNLISWCAAGDIDFSAVRTVNLDEYKGLTQSTIDANSRLFENKDEVPRFAYTMGIQTIMMAKRIVVVVSGKDKAGIVKRAFTGDIVPQVPASILQLHPDVTIVGDEDAFSELDI